MGGRITVVEECLKMSESIPAILSMEHLTNFFLRSITSNIIRGVSKNVILLICFRFIRSVAYRWTIRWLRGFLGWDNSRPLPACVYHSIRKKYPLRQSTGYSTSQDRET